MIYKESRTNQVGHHSIAYVCQMIEHRTFFQANTKQRTLIEELETKLSFQSNVENHGPSKGYNKEGHANDERNKTHTEILIAHVRQQLEDLQSFVKVPEETYDTLRQEIETVRSNTEELKKDLASNEKTCEKLRPLVRLALLMN